MGELSAHCVPHSHHDSCSSITQNLKVGRSGEKCPRLNMMSSNAAGPKYMVSVGPNLVQIHGVFEQLAGHI